MVRSTDSRRARNSDSVMIGGRRRPVSLPSRRRCFLASSLVDPRTDRTSSLPFGSRTCTTVSGGSSGVSDSDPARPSAEPRRRLRLRLRALLPAESASSAASAGPPSSADQATSADPADAEGSGPAEVSDPSRAAPSRAAPSRAAPSRAAPSRAAPSRATLSRAALVLRLRVREEGRRVSGWPPLPVSGWAAEPP